MQISWKHRDTDFPTTKTFDQKVEVFEAQTLGWQLHIAHLAANGGVPLGSNERIQAIPHGGFAVLHICFSYFELIASLVGRKGESPFKEGLQNVVPELARQPEHKQAILERLANGVRNGLYHEGRTRQGVRLTRLPAFGLIAYAPDTDMIFINPHELPKRLKAHLDVFCKRLLNPENEDLRARFERRFDSGFA